MKPINSKFANLILALLLMLFAFTIDAAEAKSKYEKQISKAIPLYLRKEYKKARKIFYKILKDEPNNIVARYYLAEIMFTDVRKYNDAAKQFEIVLKLKEKVKSKKFKIRNRYIFNNSVLKLGLVHLKNGQNVKAIELLKEFIKNDKDSPARITAFNSIAVAYSNLDDYENAIDFLEEALNIDKENMLARFNLSSINSKLIYFNTGVGLSINQKHTEAAREFVKALEVDPFFVAAHFWLGREHKYLRNFIDAENELLRAYAVNPDYVYNYKILTELAEVYVSLKDFAKAKKYIEKSLGINDRYAYSYNTLGKVNMSANDYESAIQNFKKASDIRYTPEFMENLKKAQDALIDKSKNK